MFIELGKKCISVSLHSVTTIEEWMSLIRCRRNELCNATIKLNLIECYCMLLGLRNNVIKVRCIECYCMLLDSETMLSKCVVLPFMHKICPFVNDNESREG